MIAEGTLGVNLFLGDHDHSVRWTTRGRVLVDGFHRWQENIELMEATDRGNLADIEIFRESIRRNSTHGHQLEDKDKERDAGIMWEKLGLLDPGERYQELMDLFSVSRSTVDRWTKDARKKEKEDKQARAWDMWLECESLRDIAESVLGDAEKFKTIDNWVCNFLQMTEFTQPPRLSNTSTSGTSTNSTNSAGGNIFGRMQAQVVGKLETLVDKPTWLKYHLLSNYQAQLE